MLKPSHFLRTFVAIGAAGGGVVVESGPPREVLARPKPEPTKSFLSKLL